MDDIILFKVGVILITVLPLTLSKSSPFHVAFGRFHHGLIHTHQQTFCACFGPALTINWYIYLIMKSLSLSLSLSPLETLLLFAYYRLLHPGNLFIFC